MTSQWTFAVIFCVYGEIFIAKEKDTPVGIFSEFNFQF